VVRFWDFDFDVSLRLMKIKGNRPQPPPEKKEGEKEGLGEMRKPNRTTPFFLQLLLSILSLSQGKSGFLKEPSSGTENLLIYRFTSRLQAVFATPSITKPST
jgi:hypothetical protein